MSRKSTSTLSIPAVKKKERDEITEVRKYKLITPLYGGGVEPEKSDPITVVRASEVRGHLRFWWRATRGGAYNGSLEEMRKAEEKIFGSAAGEGKAGQSKVGIRIIDAQKGGQIYRLDKPGNQRGTVEVGDPQSPWGYVAFPLRAEKDKPAGSVTDNVTFSLAITFPDELEEDIRMALWAWETFGGIGARTRRGFGAFVLDSVEGDSQKYPTRDHIQKDIREKTKKLDGYSWHKDVPHLSAEIDDYRFINTRRQSSHKEEELAVWSELFNALKKFRQTRHPDRNGRPYGRSKWPEADQICRLMSTNSPGHDPEHPVEKFPRAQFGLPIIFKFKEDDERSGDPRQSELKGNKHERLASPLILRPLRCEDGALGIATILKAPHIPPSGLTLSASNRNQDAKGTLDQDEAKKIPMLDGEKDILKAFLDYLN